MDYIDVTIFNTCVINFIFFTCIISHAEYIYQQIFSGILYFENIRHDYVCNFTTKINTIIFTIGFIRARCLAM